jgi:hypothetical protein
MSRAVSALLVNLRSLLVWLLNNKMAGGANARHEIASQTEREIREARTRGSPMPRLMLENRTVTKLQSYHLHTKDPMDCNSVQNRVPVGLPWRVTHDGNFACPKSALVTMKASREL